MGFDVAVNYMAVYVNNVTPIALFKMLIIGPVSKLQWHFTHAAQYIPNEICVGVVAELPRQQGFDGTDERLTFHLYIPTQPYKLDLKLTDPVVTYIQHQQRAG